MGIDLSAVANAISATREGLEASGYAIDCADREGRLLFTIRALEGACEECLVPKPVFTSILGRELSEGGIQVDAFDVAYPIEADGQGN